MNRFDRLAPRVTCAALLLCSLAGCETVNDWFSSDRVNYKDASSAPPLTVPPDLSAGPLENRYVAPKMTALGNEPLRTRTETGTLTAGVPNAADPLGMHVEREGDTRWLVIDGRSPDELWPQLSEFWQQNGFAVVNDQPASGLIETDWAENRAKAPNDWFRKTLGKLVDNVYSSGTRDKFRMLVERGANGGTTVTISHQAMEEMLTGRDGESSRWVDRPRNPALEVAFLARLMQKFGLNEKQAGSLVASARETQPRGAVVADAGTLRLPDDFDRAWLRVGVALDRSHFAVDSLDKSRGLYYVRYADPQNDMKREGLFGKWLGGNGNETPKKFVINVRPAQDRGTQVAVLDAQGQVDASADAQRLVAALRSQLD
jgi:outer membrane protein assembly factor BamC